jgi:hypothetical protein
VLAGSISAVPLVIFIGENPQFNDTFEFEIAFPELALVRFVVLDDESLDYDFIGQYTLPFECIQPGEVFFV